MLETFRQCMLRNLPDDKSRTLYMGIYDPTAKIRHLKVVHSFDTHTYLNIVEWYSILLLSDPGTPFR